MYPHQGFLVEPVRSENSSTPDLPLPQQLCYALAPVGSSDFGEAGMREAANRHFNWAGLPLIATVARLLCRELTLQNEYLRQENKILKSRIKGRIRFDDDERRFLVDAPWRWAGS